MIVYAIISVARQVEGEYVCVKAEKGFTDSQKAEDYARNLSRQYAETIQTPAGPIACICERGIFPIEIEG
jgi:hypothetical protein